MQIVTAPLAHIAGITGVMNNILAGRKISLIDKFTVQAFRDAVVRHRPKVAGAPPSALRMIMDANVPKEDFASLVAYRTGTAPLDVDNMLKTISTRAADTDTLPAIYARLRAEHEKQPLVIATHDDEFARAAATRVLTVHAGAVS